MSKEEIIYLDNAATSFPKPACVYRAADEFYRHYGGNAGRGSNPLAQKGKDLIVETRNHLAKWLGAQSPPQVVLAPSATIALNQIILGMSLQPGDVVYVTPFEHNSVLRPLEHLRQTKGIIVREMPFDRSTFTCDLERLEASFQAESPALVGITQASNVCGVMPSVLEIARRAKQVNPQTVVVVDGAQAAGLYPLPLDTGLIDALVFSGHKSLYGPYGVSGVVLASDWRPEPILFGGTGTRSESVVMPDTLPTAYEVGSHNIWAIAGLRAALTWLQSIGREALVDHTLDLAVMLRHELESLPGVTVYTPLNEKVWCGIVSFTVQGVRPQALEAALGAKGIAVRAGLHCAPWAHRWLGTRETGGTLRVSVGWFNELADLEALMTEISRLSA